MTREEHKKYLRERDINELLSWISSVKEEFVNGIAYIHHEQTLCRMINILYGRKALPNKNNRKKVKHLRIFKRG